MEFGICVLLTATANCSLAPAVTMRPLDDSLFYELHQNGLDLIIHRITRGVAPGYNNHTPSGYSNRTNLLWMDAVDGDSEIPVLPIGRRQDYVREDAYFISMGFPHPWNEIKEAG